MNFNLLIKKYRLILLTINMSLLVNCSTTHNLPAPINILNDKNINPHGFKKKSINNKLIINRNFINNQYLLKHKKKNSDHTKFNFRNISSNNYNHTFYKVKTGDTLFNIALITGKDYLHLAKINKIKVPYILKVGQIIKIDNFSLPKNKHYIKNNFNKKKMKIDSKKLCINNRNSNFVLIHESKKILYNSWELNKYLKQQNKKKKYNNLRKWHWPANGKIINFFSDVQGGNKGIDISGLRGQSIFATIAGKVVYSGSALRGYGNLIIIKHNDDYLTAYAHNDVILVHEQEIVNAGQKIATMGDSGTNSVKLHFEIRYKGKSVNPLCYLSYN